MPSATKQSSIKHCLTFFAVLQSTSALRVTPGSACASVCSAGNASNSSTVGSELVCNDSDYSSENGAKFENCIDCLMQSTTADSATGETDLGDALYSMRYTIDWCIFGYPNNTAGVPSDPCQVSCTPIQDSLAVDLPQQAVDKPYSYCDNGTFSAKFSQCAYCYSLINNQTYLSNFIKTLQSACQQLPSSGTTLVNGPVLFSTATSTARATSSSTAGSSHGLTDGEKVGFGLGIPAILLVVLAALSFGFARRRENTRKRLDRERFGDQNITAPLGGWSQFHTPAAATTYANIVATSPSYHNADPNNHYGRALRQLSTSPMQMQMQSVQRSNTPVRSNSTAKAPFLYKPASESYTRALDESLPRPPPTVVHLPLRGESQEPLSKWERPSGHRQHKYAQ